MEYKSIFVVAFVWLSLVSSLAEGERFLFKHEDAETKAEIGGHKRAGGSEDLHSSPSALKWSANLRQSSLTADTDLIFRTAVYTANSGEYYGTRAKINLWDLPEVQINHIASSVITLSSFDGANENSVQAGFHMYPELYNDSKLHFYTTWTLDGYKSSGCFNIKCEGFVLVNLNILTPGDVVESVSVYNGSQYFITISIKKEPQSGNWSVYREDLAEPKLIGYWPKSLFTALAEKATTVSWGGVVSYNQNTNGPPMGSGHYSSELEGKAAFVKNIEIFDSNGGSIDLANIAKPDVNREDCYNVTTLVDSSKSGLHDGYLFYFGGPGGCFN